MELRKGVWLAVLAMACVPGCGRVEEKFVRIDGSSTVYPITEAVTEEYLTQTRGAVKVTVGVSGTGGGFKKFCRGETDISDASRPIMAEEMKACREAGIEYVELPIAFDAITVVVHPQNDWADELTVAELKKIWEPAAQGVIEDWHQVSERFPSRSLKLAGPGADSGTFDYFTEAVVGRPKSSRGDYLASEDDNVIVQFVSRDRGALGYFGLAYYLENADKVKAVRIKKDESSPAVTPSVEAVKSGMYQPLSRPIFLYVNAASARDKPQVREFVEFYLQYAAELAREVGYVDLPEKAYALALANFRALKTGTAFGGVPEVGVQVEELLQRETTR